ncbi:UNKNOWN [Stylonychia lemnae]|uniref:Uncharacterized protein n=1 Tax=Stylonychia lemnae TaxID=5949 RepID=A0A078AV11_STYLE|nr:UNKNOWN [Stylonychia lemnae]|eukprot:CDW86230.1 UNKNOWN [Stylonychia lemnae]
MDGNEFAIVLSGSNTKEYILVMGSVSLFNAKVLKLTFARSPQILKKSLYIDQNQTVYLICSFQDTDTHYIIVYNYGVVQKFQITGITETNPTTVSGIILKNPFFAGNDFKVRIIGKIQFGTSPIIRT